MKKIFCITAILFILSTSLYSQQNMPHDPIGEFMFPPELVMQNQQAIKLTDNQRKSIVEEIQKLQSEFMTLQWDLQKEVESFRAIMNKPAVDETTALNQLDKILDAERKIKRRQITLMIRIKNTLTGEQQSQLQALRASN